MNENLEKLYAQLIDKYKELNFRKDSKVVLGTIPIKNSEFFKRCRDLLIELKIFELLSLDEVGLISGLAALHKEKRHSKAKKSNHWGEDDFLLVVDIFDNKRRSIYDIKNSRLTSFDPDTISETMGEGMRLKREPAILEFNPYKPPLTSTEVDGRPFDTYNTYITPEWRDKEELSQKEIDSLVLPKIFTEFMNHLVPNEECREFVFDWLHHAIVSRNGTYLVLNGEKGVGKGIFTDEFLPKLVGKSCWYQMNENGLESNFNSWLLNKRIIIMDEKKITEGSALNKVKRYANDVQTTEAKGVDAGASVRTYNSFIISNNSAEDVHIEYDDRRFSVVDLTKTKLKKVWSQEKIKEFINIEGEDLKSVGYWLFYRKPKYTNQDAWMGEHFQYLCYTSCSEWKKIIVDFCTNGSRESFGMREFKKEYRLRNDSTRLPKKQKIIDFLSNYLHLGEYVLGTLVDSTDDLENGWTIQVNPELIAINKGIKEPIEDEDIL